MLIIKDLSKNFGEKELFRKAHLELFERERVCLIAPNGSGKTTLIKMILKKDQEYEGQIHLYNQYSMISIAQELPTSTLPLFDFVASKLPIHKEYKKLQELQEELDKDPRNLELLNLYGEKQSVFERSGGFTYIFEVKKVLEGLGFKEKEDFERSIQTFSGGELRRALLVEALIQKPDLLILDEPTNHLDLKNILFLENYLMRYPKTVFFISHDTEFIEKVATHTVTIENGQLVKVKGGFSLYLKSLEQRLVLYAKKKNELENQIDKLKPSIAKFKAGTRSTQAQSMQRRLDVLEEELKTYEVSYTKKAPIHFKGKMIEKSYDPVLKVEDLDFSLQEIPFFKGLNLTLKRGEKTTILAPNGTGKTLFLNQLIKAFTKKNPRIQYGQNVTCGYFLQEDKSLANNFGDLTPIEYLREVFRSEYSETEYFKYCAGFHLKSYLPIKSLSGGEKSKLRLLKLLLENSNFLILDEPTNHMDIESIEGISHLIKEYKGTLLFVTHNRKILKDLNPTVYLLQGKKLRLMDTSDWNEVFNSLQTYTKESPLEDLEENDTSLELLKEIKKEKEEKKENPFKKASKETKMLLKQKEKEIQAVIKEIHTKEQELARHKEMQLKEEVYTDYKKSAELDKMIKEQELLIAELYTQYTHLEKDKKQLAD